MNRNLVIGVAVAAILLVGGYLLYNQKGAYSNPNPTLETQQTSNDTANTATSSASQGTNYTVEITSAGFSLDTVKIKSGDTVTWVVKDSDSHRVASNPHPIHTDLRGFDSLKAIKSGESYSFTFSKVGTWGYHDHLNPGFSGKVVVE